MTMLTDPAPAAADVAPAAQAEAAPPVVDTPAAAPAADNAPAPVDAPPADDKPADDKPAGAPEAYEWKLDDGVAIDESGLTAFSSWAKQNNLTQEQANSLLNNMATASAERQQQAHTEAVNEWISKAQADTEFGGRDLQQNLAVAKKAIDQFGTPELAKLLNDSGLGNHPEIIRAFYRAGKAISEDKFVGGSRVPQAADDIATRMYPSMN